MSIKIRQNKQCTDYFLDIIYKKTGKNREQIYAMADSYAYDSIDDFIYALYLSVKNNV